MLDLTAALATMVDVYPQGLGDTLQSATWKAAASMIPDMADAPGPQAQPHMSGRLLLEIMLSVAVHAEVDLTGKDHADIRYSLADIRARLSGLIEESASIDGLPNDHQHSNRGVTS